jgi:hypothetical protein
MQFSKFWFLFFYFSIVCESKSKVNFKSNKSNLIKAVDFVSNEIYAKTMSTLPTINLIWIENVNDITMKDFINDLLSSTSKAQKFAFRLETAEKVKSIGKRRRLKNILVLRSFSEFKEIYSKVTPEIFKLNGFYPYYMFVLFNGEIVEVQEMFNLLWKLQMFNVNVIFENENGEFLVQTFKPFNDQNCNDTTPITINKFKDGKFINSIEDFFPNKMNNLHNCPVQVAISEESKPLIVIKTLENGTKLFTGRDIQLLNSLSKSLSFRINYTFIGEEGFLLENGSAVGALKALLDGKAGLSVSDWWLKPNRLMFFDATSSYISDHLIFVVPPGREFTALEKLIYPLKLMSWTLVGGCFLAGILLIFLIKHKSKKLQDFVFGTGVRTPYLNLFIAYIGGMQNKLPGRNFARFLLMMTLISSLIIRTLYLASFYELLKSNRNHKELQTIKEMVEKDYKLYVREGNFELFQGTESLKTRFEVEKTFTKVDFSFNSFQISIDNNSRKRINFVENSKRFIVQRSLRYVLVQSLLSEQHQQ